jgi:bifunctional enzyme CysN/CysC
VQWVNRPNLDFRGFSGTVASGEVKRGDEVVVAHSGKTAQIARVVTADGDRDSAKRRRGGDPGAGSRDRYRARRHAGRPATAPRSVCQFAAEILWMTDEEMLPGRSYLLKAGGPDDVPASVTTLKHKLNVNSFEKEPGKS